MRHLLAWAIAALTIGTIKEAKRLREEEKRQKKPSMPRKPDLATNIVTAIGIGFVVLLVAIVVLTNL
jgi:hypothetical protein